MTSPEWTILAISAGFFLLTCSKPLCAWFMAWSGLVEQESRETISQRERDAFADLVERYGPRPALYDQDSEPELP